VYSAKIWPGGKERGGGERKKKRNGHERFRWLARRRVFVCWFHLFACLFVFLDARSGRGLTGLEALILQLLEANLQLPLALHLLLHLLLDLLQSVRNGGCKTTTTKNKKQQRSSSSSETFAIPISRRCPRALVAV